MTYFAFISLVDLNEEHSVYMLRCSEHLGPASGTFEEGYETFRSLNLTGRSGSLATALIPSHSASCVQVLCDQLTSCPCYHVFPTC